MRSTNYLHEVQKFATSQYWNSGLRISAGILVPLLVLVHNNWLSYGIPFLWGALFVSLTDTPGPVHHRRNGMIAAILLNTLLVFVTAFTREHQVLLICQIIIAGFLLSMANVYGARAGAVGVLALVVMLLNLLSTREEQDAIRDSLLIAGGGLWYTVFSLLLYRIRPYRIVEQALGEHLISIAEYIRARAAFYKAETNVQDIFKTVMEKQSAVRKIQDQTQELLFKTRRIVSDPSPKSRSMMMIYLDSLDLFEETMYSYHDYQLLQERLSDTQLLRAFYGLILQLAAELEHIGVSVQAGLAVKRNLDLTKRLSELETRIHDEETRHVNKYEVMFSLNALLKILKSIQIISNRINKLILYTRLEAVDTANIEMAQKISKGVVSHSFHINIFKENLTFQSNTFKHAIRLTSAMVIAYTVSLLFNLSHSYWVLLTIVTIMKPAYAVTRRRNFERVGGTLLGVIIVFLILWLVTNNTVLLSIMVISMLIAYSLLRMNYFGFVVFLTIFIIISFYFLDPLHFNTLIAERLVDTFVGSAIAFFCARFIFPVWNHEGIKETMLKMVRANRQYFMKAWQALKDKATETEEYETARQHAVVSLTNLSDNFQHMLVEPRPPSASNQIHQFVIASHMLTGHIAALSRETGPFKHSLKDDLETIVSAIDRELMAAEHDLAGETFHERAYHDGPSLSNQTLNQLVMVFSLARDIRKIAAGIK